MLAVALTLTLAHAPALPGAEVLKPQRLRLGERPSNTTAPGAWRTLTLLGEPRWGGRFFLLGKSAGGPATGAPVSTAALALALAFEFDPRWPSVFVGVEAVSAAAGQLRGRRVGVAGMLGLMWVVPRLFDRR